jgi:hypothetical protein
MTNLLSRCEYAYEEDYFRNLPGHRGGDQWQ